MYLIYGIRGTQVDTSVVFERKCNDKARIKQAILWIGISADDAGRPSAIGTPQAATRAHTEAKRTGSLEEGINPAKPLLGKREDHHR
jgi:hypothetical protein